MDDESRSPYGERGLKWTEPFRRADHGNGRSPYGERGLKCQSTRGVCIPHNVALLTESVD